MTVAAEVFGQETSTDLADRREQGFTANHKMKGNMALTGARRRRLDAIDQYEREVGPVTDLLKSVEKRLVLVSVERQTEFINRIRQGRDAYDEALRTEGRPVPHRSH